MIGMGKQVLQLLYDSYSQYRYLERMGVIETNLAN